MKTNFFIQINDVGIVNISSTRDDLRQPRFRRTKYW